MPVNKEPLILSLETTTRAGSIALTKGRHVLSARTGEAQSSHSTDLLENVRAVLMEAGKVISDVELFAVASGPGSFTGLRIGLATVKSFAVTLSRPCVGVPTLYAVALSAGLSSHTLALLPAGRGEAFAQLLAVEPEGRVRPLSEPVHLPPVRLLKGLSHIRRLKLAGEGVQIYAKEIEECAGQAHLPLLREGEHDSSSVSSSSSARSETAEEGWTLAPATKNLATHVAAEAWRLFLSDEVCAPDQLQAIYVRPSDAELNEQCQA